MDRPKSKVIKSKSSNTAISLTNKSEKKCKSNGQFKPDILKRRGVYVEKKSDLQIKQQTVDNEPKRKVMPRPGRTTFLASVLTILSKATAGTQYPDPEEIELTKKDRKKKRKDLLENRVDVISEVEPKTQKYKSRVLNANPDQIVNTFIVEPKRDLKSNPSSYMGILQDRESSRLACIPPFPSLQDTNKPATNQYSTEKRVRVFDPNDEPPTIVAEQTGKDTKKIYNFFVDLLESTFDVCNARDGKEEKPRVSSAASSKVTLEIDQVVAKTLSITNPKNQQEKSQQKLYYKQLNRKQTNDEIDILDIVDDLSINGICRMPKRKTILKETPLKRKRPSRFDYSVENKKSPAITKSLSYEKAVTKKDRKKDLLSLLKKQLSMNDYQQVEEPQNLFQALKIMSRYRNRCQKAIRFRDEPVKENYQRGSLFDCMYNSRKLISNRGKSKKNENSKRKIDKLKDIESKLSLEVYGYDFEKPKVDNVDDVNDVSDRSITLSDLSFDLDNNVSDNDDLKYIY